MSGVKFTFHQLFVVGAARVGKSALSVQFVAGRFGDEYAPDAEDLCRKYCLVDDEPAILDILDTAGDQEEFVTVMTPYGGLADGFLLVYSITSRESFEEITTFYQHILRFKDKGSFSAILVANKCDLEFEREVGIHEGRDLANHLGCGFIETSAKRSTNVDQAFKTIVREIRKRDEVPLFPNFGTNSKLMSLFWTADCTIHTSQHETCRSGFR
ncbi:ras family-domain-containing protein [Thelephora terrestris]|uniref:Ras family-domain-containing protein n=1 Tax=Thelephora terrestris TaxID=56493 RepID=A0A9P6HEB6_9AGAM|nr:ras family-domain-containing protein [Thelephora terrestris]